MSILVYLAPESMQFITANKLLMERKYLLVVLQRMNKHSYQGLSVFEVSTFIIVHMYSFSEPCHWRESSKHGQVNLDIFATECLCF